MPVPDKDALGVVDDELAAFVLAREVAVSRGRRQLFGKAASEGAFRVDFASEDVCDLVAGFLAGEPGLQEAGDVV